MQLNHLKYFFEVAKAGSYTQASRNLKVAQPSISKTVRQLEEAIGARLLDRSVRSGVSLTEVGQIYFDACQRVFGEIDNLKHVARQRECQGKLSIGASDNLANYVLPRFLAVFLKRHRLVVPQVFSGTSEEIKQEILSGKLELGLFHSPVADHRLYTEELGCSKFVIIVGKKWERTPLEDLPLISPRASDYVKPYPILAMLHAAGIRPRSFIEANSQETQKRLAEAGLGYAVIPQYMATDAIARKELKIVPHERELKMEVYLCQKQGRTLSLASQKFRDLLRSTWRP